MTVKTQKNYKGAIIDYTKAIEINPNNTKVYYNRGFLKVKLKDNYGAISDFTKAIEINHNYGRAYGNRGIAKENIGDLKGACSDWKKAIELGVTGAAEWVKNQCN
jgi:tetratricopeptide (TPR) repeat protein